MKRKLKCVLVDDDELVIHNILDLCESSPVAEITHSFLSPKEFLKSMPSLDFDLCLLDIYMPEIEGLIVAQLLEGKPVIFVTGAEPKLKDALELSPIDIITKPVKKERLDKALDKAYALISEKREYEMFNIAQNKGKVKLRLSDIFFVKADTVDPRNKDVIMYDDTKYTLMDCTFDELLELSPGLAQINKSELVSMDAIEEVDYDIITLKATPSDKNWKNRPKQVFLSASFRRKLMSRLSYR